ncbi:MAG TPA: serine hydrolase domain-containing protein [Acetobacteraceae bacterium]|nr:serine hydrolase domain-containing protein [Acetobacteraceae bacterium]
MRKSSVGSAGMSTARLERLGPAMQSYVDRGIYAGISTIVARRGVVVQEGQYGLRDKEAGLPMTEDTIFRLYSMTKPIVCTAFMTLFEEGRFRLIDPVCRYVSSFAAVKVLQADGTLANPQRPVTLRDLMAHTSGLSYHFFDDTPVGRTYVNAKLLDPHAPLAAAIDDLARYPLAFEPGMRWHYSVGIDVAARVIEVISGQTLADFLRERLFEPLGMVDTAFDVPASKRDRLAAMYGRPDILDPAQTFKAAFTQWLGGTNERIDVAGTYPIDAPATFQRGGHGLFGTVRDYFRFAQMLANGGEFDGVRILGRKTLALMHTNHLPLTLLPLKIGDLPLPGYGFGLGSRVALDVAETGAPGSVGEFGWSGAAKTHYWVDPIEQVVALFMTQSMSSFDLPELDLRALAYGAIVE